MNEQEPPRSRSSGARSSSRSMRRAAPRARSDRRMHEVERDSSRTSEAVIAERRARSEGRRPSRCPTSPTCAAPTSARENISCTCGSADSARRTRGALTARADCAAAAMSHRGRDGEGPSSVHRFEARACLLRLDRLEVLAEERHRLRGQLAARFLEESRLMSTATDLAAVRQQALGVRDRVPHPSSSTRLRSRRRPRL